MQSSIQQQEKWSIGRKIWILFIAVYFMLLMLDFTSSDEIFPAFVYSILKFYTAFWDWIIPWTGKHILHLSYLITVKPNGSGDTTYNYILQLLELIFAIIIAVIWAVADRKRKSYNHLFYWLRIVVRYYLVYVLFVYGFIKIIKLQFPAPSLVRLTETYGDSSPMGLAWTFVGYSSGYNYFIGGAEVLGGILLLFKRTSLIGSLVAMIVMANVAAINFAFDVPVKIFSVNLVIMAAWIAWYDVERLINLFFLNKTALPASLAMPVQKRGKKIVQVSFKVLVIVFALYSTLWADLNASKSYGDKSPKPPMYGIYDVKTFIKNGDTLLPLTTDTTRWKQIIINNPRYITVRTMTDSVQVYHLKIDTVKHDMQFTSFDSSIDFYIAYHEPVKDSLLFNGIIKNDKIRMVVKRFDISKFRLLNRGFHWINEYPYNR